MNYLTYHSLKLVFVTLSISILALTACTETPSAPPEIVEVEEPEVRSAPPRMAELSPRGDAVVDWPEDYPGCSALGIPARGFARGTLSNRGEMLGWSHLSGDSTRSWMKVTVQFFSETCFGYYYSTFEEMTFNHIGRELTADRNLYGGYRCRHPEFDTLSLPMASGDSIAIYASIDGHDSPLKNYLPDTLEGYRPKLIIDHYFPEEGVVKGRFAGGFVRDPSCTYNEELFPLYMQVDEAVFEAKLRL